MAEVWRLDWAVVEDEIENIGPRCRDTVPLPLVACIDGGQAMDSVEVEVGDDIDGW